MKKVMKVAVLTISFCLIVASVALAKPAIVLVGGKGGNTEQLEAIQKQVQGSVIVVPNKFWPKSEAAEELLSLIKEKGVSLEEGIIFVAHSAGGLLVRTIDAEHQGLVKKIVTLNTPSGGFGPAFVRWFFDTGDKNSKTPMYAIVTWNNSTPKAYMGSEKNDGVVDLKSALDFRGRKVNDLIVIEGLEHTEMLQSKEVIQLIKSWVL